MYSQYAPLGATLKRIEREIDVREKEYLEILHHLGLAKLKQQNEEMMAKMKILDHPQLPINPKPTKRKLYIIVIILFAFIFSVLGFLVFELLDKTIKFPKRIEELSDLKVAGACASVKQKKGIDISSMNLAGLKTVTESVLYARNNAPEEPVVVQFFSHWQSEGKSFIAEALKNHLTEIGYQVNLLSFQSEEKNKSLQLNLSMKQVRDAKSYSELIQLNEDTKVSDIVLVEVPAASGEMFNPTLLNTATLSYLIADARRNWEAADDYLLRNKKEQIKGNLQCILNNVHPDEMIGVVGRTPKQSWYHKFYKNRRA